MNRRRLLRWIAALPFVSSIAASSFLPTAASAAAFARSRVRPGDPGWPAQIAWDGLKKNVGGRLIKVASPLQTCAESASVDTCEEIFSKLKNPYYLGDEAGLTQSLGWADAWMSSPSIYAVEADTTGDVVAAVNFVRENNLRLVVKGGGTVIRARPMRRTRC